MRSSTRQNRLASIAAADRLSRLPDEVLHRILSLTPAKEAASTSALSRRWRGLWLQAGVLNLDSRRYGPDKDYSYTGRRFDAFLRGAKAALAAFRRRGAVLRKLTLFKDRSCCPRDDDYYSSSPRKDDKVDLFGTILADPATARLEELRVECEDQYSWNRDAVQLGALPCAATLRVLEFSNCDVGPKPGLRRGAFPSLTTLLLRNTVLPEGCLQAVPDAAPRLATVRLHEVRHERADANPEKRFYGTRGSLLRFWLRAPAVTDFAISVCSGDEYASDDSPLPEDGIDLDLPSLESLRYRGRRARLTMKLPMPRLARVDLDDHGRGKDHQTRSRPGKLVPLSTVIANFRDTRALKLRVSCVEEIIGVGDDYYDEQAGQQQQPQRLPAFPNLEVVDLEGQYKYKSEHTAATFATLLASSPKLAELRLKTSAAWDYRYYHVLKDPEESRDCTLAQYRFARSVDRFNTFNSPVASFLGGIQDCCAITELPALSHRNFTCLDKSFRKVELQFKAKDMDCFEVQLVKFLVENALPLEEIHIDDGEKVFWDHLHHKVRKWRTDAFHKKKLRDHGRFAVYNLVLKQ